MSLLRVNLQEVVHNLNSCNVKTEGICCYFPQYCDPLAKCYSTTPTSLVDLPGTFPRCMCPDGYEGDGRTKGSGCSNVDECERGIARCQHVCVDLIPGFRCECRAGWRLQPDGRSCRDIDECQEHTHNCSHICRNTKGSYRCECPVGFRLGDDLHTCIDIDECAEGAADLCPYPELCTNTEGSYHCGCPPGLMPSSYQLSSPVATWDVQQSATCEDINECVKLGSEACPNSVQQGRVTQICENVYGTHICKCLPGTRPVKADYLQDWVTTKHGVHRMLTDIIDNDLLAVMASFKDEKDGNKIIEVESSESDVMIETDLSSSNESLPLEFDDLEDSASQPSSDALLSSEDWSDTPVEPTATSTHTYIHPFAKYDEQIAQHAFVFGRRIAGEELIESPHSPGRAARRLQSRPDPVELEDDELVVSGFDKPALHVLESRRNQAANERASLVCEDIDECSEGTDLCPRDVSKCVNTFRGYECVCNDENATFDEQSKTCAVAIATERPKDQCDAHFCHSPCQLTPNGYFCGCPKGFIAKSTSGPQEQADNFRNEREWQAQLTNVECEDVDECSLPGVKMCGINCACRNTYGSFECVCPENRRKQVAPINDDYDFLLAVSQQFVTHVKMYDEKALIRVLNRNGPRNAVTAWLSIPNGALSEMQWMVDQIDWSKSGYISLDSSFDRSLSDLSSSSNLTRDFIKETVAALRRSQVNMCLRQSPCRPGACPSSKPCCKANPNGDHQCYSASKPLLRVTSKKSECPTGSTYQEA